MIFDQVAKTIEWEKKSFQQITLDIITSSLPLKNNFIAFYLALLYLSWPFSNFSLNPLIHPGSYITMWVLISTLWRWNVFGYSSWLSYNFSTHTYPFSFCLVFSKLQLTRFISTLTSLHHYSETLTMCTTSFWKTISNGQVLLISVLNIYQSSFSLHMSLPDSTYFQSF